MNDESAKRLGLGYALAAAAFIGVGLAALIPGTIWLLAGVLSINEALAEQAWKADRFVEEFRCDYCGGKEIT